MAKLVKRHYARTAYLQQVLVEYDGPQVALFRSDRGYPMVSVIIDDPDIQAGELLIHISETSDDVLRRYMNEKVDLRYLFLEGSKKRYIADWAEMDQNGWLDVVRAQTLTESYALPDHGFWSRFHTEELLGTVYATDSLAKFAIDGAWDASDFSRFYGRMADLYAFLAITSETAVASLADSTLLTVKTAIKNAGWRGGGSYVGFYDTIFAKVDALRPLKVRRIKYASPGTIELKGSEEPLHDVARVVDSYGSDGEALKLSYTIVDRLLSKHGLKRALPGTAFPSETDRKIAYDHCLVIAKGLGIGSPKTLYDLCDSNTVIFAKITLSFYRRARELHAFHAEGRVTADGFGEDNAHPEAVFDV